MPKMMAPQSCTYSLRRMMWISKLWTRRISHSAKVESTVQRNTPQMVTDFHDTRINDIIDVRTPKEYALDHIPGAVNLPVLNDQERVEVGTLYSSNRFQARKTGAAEVTKNISKHLTEYFQTKPPEYSPLIYCWRGGQRSHSMALILSEIGFQTFCLQGGYRYYRNSVRQELQTLPRQFKYKIISGNQDIHRSMDEFEFWSDLITDYGVICLEHLKNIVSPGLTGIGKTKILETLKEDGEQVIDLEMLAKHKGSVLGLWHGETQPTQKYWESLLAKEMRVFSSNRTVWVESESRRIGNVTIPECLFEVLCDSPRVIINLPLEERVKHILRDYPNWLQDKDFLKKTLVKLIRVQGHKQVNKWMCLIDQGKMDVFVESILTEHYDPAYTLSQKKNNYNKENTESLDIPNLEKDSLKKLVKHLKTL